MDVERLSRLMDSTYPYHDIGVEKVMANRKDRDYMWGKLTYLVRSWINPNLFEHAERLSRGECTPLDDPR